MIGNFLSQFSFDVLVSVAQGSATVIAVAGVAYIFYSVWRLL